MIVHVVANVQSPNVCCECSTNEILGTSDRNIELPKKCRHIVRVVGGSQDPEQLERSECLINIEFARTIFRVIKF